MWNIISYSNIQITDRSKMSIVKPNKELRCEPLKRALSTFVVPVILKKYQIVALRALLSDKDEKSIWAKRRAMEYLLSKDEKIGGFFSCITALEQIDGGKEKIVSPGVSFWIFFDWPAHGIDAFTNRVVKMFLMSEMQIKQCTPIRSRGNFFIKYNKDIK